MLNQVKPVLVSGSKIGLMKSVLVPPVKPPPCTRMAVRKGPGPSGMLASSVRLTSPTLAYSMSVFTSARAGRAPATAATPTTRSARNDFTQDFRFIMALIGDPRLAAPLADTYASDAGYSPHG